MAMELMTCTAAARQVGITRETVYRWRQLGLIGVRAMVGPYQMVDVMELERVAAQRRQWERRGRPRLSEQK